MRLRKALQRAVIGSFIAGAFALGAAHIYVSNLAIGHRFFVYGQGRAFVGEPAFFRISAFANFPPAPLSGGRLELAVHGTNGLMAEHRVQLDGDGRAAFSMPPIETAGEYELRAKLFEGEALRAQSSFAVQVERREPPVTFRVDTPDAGNEPLRVELLSQHQRVAAMLSSEVFVRVTERQSWKPLMADLRIEQSYGQSEFGAPRTLRTDAFGLASFELEALTESDWSLSVHDGQGRSATVKRNLAVWSPSLTLQPSSHVWVYGEPLRLSVRSLYSGDEQLYLDLYEDGVWLAAYSSKMRELASVRWEPTTLAKPEEARPLTLLACFSDVSCDDAHARVALLYSPQPLSDIERVTRLAAFVQTDAGYLREVLQPERLAAAPPQALGRLERLLAARIQTNYLRPAVLVRSELAAVEALEAEKAEFRATGAVLFVLWHGAGGLMLAFWVLRGVLARRRAMREVTDEDDAEREAQGSEPAEEAKSGSTMATLETAGTWVEITALALSIIVFAGALLLLYQKI